MLSVTHIVHVKAAETGMQGRLFVGRLTRCTVAEKERVKMKQWMRCCRRGMSMISRKYRSTVPSRLASLTPLCFGCSPCIECRPMQSFELEAKMGLT